MKLFFIRKVERSGWIFMVVAARFEDAGKMLNDFLEITSPSTELGSINLPGYSGVTGVIAATNHDKANILRHNDPHGA